MGRDKISRRGAAFLIFAVIQSNNVVLGLSLEVAQDAWISLLFSVLLVVPVAAMYARMTVLMPDRDLLEMAQYALGSFPARVVGVFMALYAVQLGAVVLQSFAEFFHIIALNHTPVLMIMLTIFAAALYLTKSGVRTLGKWAGFMMLISLVTVTLVTLFSWRSMQLDNIMPVLAHPTDRILADGVRLVPYPFAEIVLILAVAGNLESERPYRYYIGGTLLGALFLMVVFLRSILILGPSLMESVQFPVFEAARIIEVGPFLQRVESLVSYNYVLIGVTKLALCVIMGAKCLAKACKLPKYERMLTPVGFLTVALGSLTLISMMQMRQFLELYRIYAPFFQILIPLVVWIAAEIKTRSPACAGER